MSRINLQQCVMTEEFLSNFDFELSEVYGNLG